MSIINNTFFKRLYIKLFNEPYNISYSQCGEDILIKFFLDARKINKITYLDVGSNHPVKLNNTFLFIPWVTMVCVLSRTLFCFPN